MSNPSSQKLELKALIESDMQHHLWLMTLDNKLSLAPLKRDPLHVLDLGTGTGIWAIEYGNFTDFTRSKDQDVKTD
jgi:ubiquinone/menaquinone biosynthesis C-methylase UbiE